jgi:hypothetical protein
MLNSIHPANSQSQTCALYHHWECRDSEDKRNRNLDMRHLAVQLGAHAQGSSRLRVSSLQSSQVFNTETVKPWSVVADSDKKQVGNFLGSPHTLTVLGNTENDEKQQEWIKINIALIY